MTDEGILAKLDTQIKNKLQQTGSWIYSGDGKTIIKIASTLSSLAIIEPVGFLVPLIIDASDIVIRRRFLKHLPDLASRISNINNINHKFAESEQGQKLLKDAMRQIIHETNEEKIEYLKQFLVKSYSNKKPDAELINTFFKILIQMEPVHIKLLVILKNPKEIMVKVANERKQNPRPVDERKYGQDCAVYFSEDVTDDLNTFYLNVEPLVYSNAHNDLVTWNILKNKVMKFWLYFDEPNFSTNLNHHLREIERWITPFGEEFIKYLHENESEK